MDEVEAGLASLMERAQKWDRNLLLAESHASSLQSIHSNIKKTYALASTANVHATQAHNLASQFSLTGASGLGQPSFESRATIQTVEESIEVCADTLLEQQPLTQGTTKPDTAPSGSEVTHLERRILEL